MRFSRRKGSIVVMLAGGSAALLGMAGLVVDYGHAAWQKAHLQAVMDAAALAGGQDLPNVGLAAVAAAAYVQANGEEPRTMAVSYARQNTRITVTMTKVVPTLFMRVLGVNGMAVTASATGELRGPGGAFDYAVCAGSQDYDLPLTGGGYQFKGGIHGNRNLLLDGANWLITGAVEAVGTITTIGSSMSMGTLSPNASAVQLPDYRTAVVQRAVASGNIYNYDHSLAASEFASDAMYVRGSAVVTGSGYASTGVLVADGTLKLYGTGQLVSGGNQVCFYSLGGDVVLNGDDITLDGVLFAPHGKVIINGNRVTINGAIVGDRVIVNGDTLTVDRENHPIKALEGHHVKLVQSG